MRLPGLKYSSQGTGPKDPLASSPPGRPSEPLCGLPPEPRQKRNAHRWPALGSIRWQHMRRPHRRQEPRDFQRNQTSKAKHGWTHLLDLSALLRRRLSQSSKRGIRTRPRQNRAIFCPTTSPQPECSVAQYRTFKRACLYVRELDQAPWDKRQFPPAQKCKVTIRRERQRGNGSLEWRLAWSQKRNGERTRPDARTERGSPRAPLSK